MREKSRFQHKDTHMYNHAAAQTTWREERDAAFVAGNTVIILSY